MRRKDAISKNSDSVPLELVARRLKALADASRLRVLQSLCDGEKSVTALVEETELGQANVSKHLRILKDEGFVLSRRNLRNVIYRLSDTLSEEICTIMCRSMKKKAVGESRTLERYLDRKRVGRAG
jgi:DNA-binding transcriptional ArsR family regulator